MLDTAIEVTREGDVKDITPLVFLTAWNLAHQHVTSGFVKLSIVVAPVLVYECAHLSLALDIATDANFKTLKYFKTMPIE